MDKHFVLSKIKDYEAHLDNVAPLMESDDQLIMNELIREINNTCHVKIRGFSDLCDSYIKGAGSIIAKHINCFHSHLIRSALVFHLVGSKKHECGRVNGCEQIQGLSKLKLLCLLAAALMMLLSCNVNIAGGIHTDNTQSLYVFATILQYKFLIS